MSQVLSVAARFIPAVFVALLATPAAAYIGPGAGLGVFAVVLALGVGVVFLIVGLVWYPAKRFLKRKKRDEAGNQRSEKG